LGDGVRKDNEIKHLAVEKANVAFETTTKMFAVEQHATYDFASKLNNDFTKSTEHLCMFMKDTLVRNNLLNDIIRGKAKEDELGNTTSQMNVSKYYKKRSIPANVLPVRLSLSVLYSIYHLFVYVQHFLNYIRHDTFIINAHHILFMQSFPPIHLILLF